MRILFLNKASPKHEGGAEIRTREVGKRLAACGHEVTVLSAKTRIQDPSFEILDGMKLYHKKVLPDWLIRRFPAPSYFTLAAANFFLMWHLYLLMKKENFDLIREDISPFPPSFLLALIRLPASSRIAVVHNLPRTWSGWIQFYGPFYGTAGFLFDRLLRAGRLKYDRIVCAAKWLADDLSHSPPIAGKVSYVPNGVDLERFSNGYNSPRPPLNLRGGERGSYFAAYRLLSVGRLVENKGHRYLIEALPYLKQDYPQLKLTILGKGPLKDSLIGLSRQLCVEDQIEILPPVPHEEMPQVYRQFDFFVFPSLTEGFPMTLLEAMAARLPVIASNIPGVREVIDENSATLVSNLSASNLAGKIKWAIGHLEEIAQKTAAAYQLSKKYRWDIIGEQELGVKI